MFLNTVLISIDPVFRAG